MSAKTDLPSLLSARADRAKSRDVRKFRPDIEGLRAVAVTLVALSHLGLALPGGYVGVDVFFVISGFLITRQLTAELDQTGRISFRGFYARRVRRILPAATVVIVGTVLACWRWDSPLRVKTDASDGLFAAFSAINWRLAVNGTNYFQASSPPSPFQHFWSLSVEEQFYAVWPVLLLVIGVAAGRRYGRRKSAVWALLVIIAAALVLTTDDRVVSVLGLLRYSDQGLGTGPRCASRGDRRCLDQDAAGSGLADVVAGARHDRTRRVRLRRFHRLPPARLSCCPSWARRSSSPGDVPAGREVPSWHSGDVRSSSWAGRHIRGTWCTGRS